MKKSLRSIISVFICLVLLLVSSVSAFATNDKNNNKNNGKPVPASVFKGFKDVPSNFWAYDDIMWMYNRNIISGTGNGNFNPNGTVTRAEFAKIMVNTLQLQQYKPETPSFIDVKKNAWEYPFVESAKTYLTGYRTTGGDLFMPSQNAVREDMAVALVKALGYQNEAIDESILAKFADAGSISPNLKKFVALAVKHELIQGYTQNGQTLFDPMGKLTRAQAATLLYKAFKNNEEKITYDEDKVTYPDNGTPTPTPTPTPTALTVSVAVENNVTVLRWNKVASDKFKEYRVVISKNTASPKFPENGFLYTITDINRNYAVIDNSTKYTGGDFGNYLTVGQTYNFSVTAVYNDKRVTGSTAQFQYAGPANPDEYVLPQVSASMVNGKLLLTWTKINSPKLVSYRVVASKVNHTPAYPGNGFLVAITDKEHNYAVIENTAAYTNGDFGGYFVKGEKYYFSVTAEYTDRVIAGTAVEFTYNLDDAPAALPAPVVSYEYLNNKLILKWNKIESPQLVEYKVVISKNNNKPAYPANGFLKTVLDANTTSAAIQYVSKDTDYTNADFDKLTYGEAYYFSVTAVYNNNKFVAGNAVQVPYLIPTQPK